MSFWKQFFCNSSIKNPDKKIGLPFYEYDKHGIQNLEKLERNARIWQMILSKIINPTRNINPIAHNNMQPEADNK